MKKIVVGLSLALLLVNCTEKKNNRIFVSDLDNYWNAYDQVVGTKDTTLQKELFKENFINKASKGQQELFENRNYTIDEYLENIRSYPRFWNSLRKNMLGADELSSKVTEGIQGLAGLYPELKPAEIYFCMGAFRTPGTAVDSLILIGSEYAFSNPNVDTSEFPEQSSIINYSKANDLDELPFLNTHEYVHTQQLLSENRNVLKVCLYEGVAEFLAELSTNKKSFQQAMQYGKENDSVVKKQLKRELFSSSYERNWIWNSNNNVFQMRDVGYYVGHCIAKGYYDNAVDKKQAIKELIELNYDDEKQLYRIVDDSGYFSKPLTALKKEFEETVPKVLGIKTFENNSKNVDPNIKIITVEFSEAMQKRTSFDFGPLGMKALMRVQRFVDLFVDEEQRILTFEVNLEPNTHYQLSLGSNFRSVNGDISIEPYLIDFYTAKE